MLCAPYSHCQQRFPLYPSTSGKVDISLLLKSKDEEEVQSTASGPVSSRSASVPATTIATSTTANSTPASVAATVPSKRSSATGAHLTQSPAKKQSKWSPEEDTKIIQLRGEGMKWEDISKQLPGRSSISCRLHYQNYLERRSEWDEDRKNKLARLYERFKPEMWAKVAEEMSIPWRAAEAMHWQIGEQEMARRAGVTPFSLTSSTGMPPNTLPPRAHLRSNSAAPRPRRDSGSRAMAPQLPSVAELTAGLPAYVTSPRQPYPMRRSPPDAYHHPPQGPRR